MFLSQKSKKIEKESFDSSWHCSWHVRILFQVLLSVLFIVVLAGLCSLTSWVRMDLRRRLVAWAASAQGRCEGEAVGAWTIYPVEFSGLPLASCLWHHPSSTKVFAAHCDLVVVVDDWWWQSNERRWSDGQMVVSYHFRYPACSKKGHLRRCDFVIAESGL